MTFVTTAELRFPWKDGTEAKTAVQPWLQAMQKADASAASAACSRDATVNTREDNEDTRADLAVSRLADTVTSAETHRTAKAAMMLAASPMVLVLLPSTEAPLLQDWKLVAFPIEYLRPVGEEHRKDSVHVEMNAHSFLKQLAVASEIRQVDKVKPLHVLQFFDVFMPQSGSW